MWDRRCSDAAACSVRSPGRPDDRGSHSGQRTAAHAIPGSRSIANGLRTIAVGTATWSHLSCPTCPRARCDRRRFARHPRARRGFPAGYPVGTVAEVSSAILPASWPRLTSNPPPPRPVRASSCSSGSSPSRASPVQPVLRRPLAPPPPCARPPCPAPPPRRAPRPHGPGTGVPRKQTAEAAGGRRSHL